MVAALALTVVVGSNGAWVQSESPRLRTLLPNGAVTLVERMPAAKSLSVQLFAGVRGAQETRGRHGWRHLLEHLILKGKGGNLDGRMEAQGVFFTGRTYRDALQIEFAAPPDRLDAVLAALTEILDSPIPKSEEIGREIGIIEQEFALRGDAGLLSATAWAAAFEDQALDPFGTTESLRKATPEALDELRKQIFVPCNLVLLASGPVELDKVGARLKALLQDREGPVLTREIVRKGESARRQTDEAFGEARGALVRGVKETAAALCAANAIAASIEGAAVTYTPSVETGLVLVTRTDANNTVGSFIDGMQEGEMAALMPIGRLMAERYLSQALARPAGSGYWRGMMLAQNAGARPEDLLEGIRTTNWSEFKQAFAAFQKEKAVVAVGVRR